MSKALYISSFIPDKLAGHAGGQLSYHNLVRLQKKYTNVDIVICSTEKTESKHNFDFFYQSKFNLIMGWLYLIINFTFKGIFVWHILNTRANIKFILTVQKYLKENIYDEVLFDFTQSVYPFIKDIEKLKSTKISVFIHDVYWQKITRSGNFKQNLIKSVFNLEYYILKNFDEVITVSKKDAELLNTLYNIKDVIINEFIPPQWCENVKLNFSPNNNIIFFANFNRNENIEALEWFVKDSLEKLINEFFDFKLIVLGMGSEKFNYLKDKYFDNVMIVGYIEDPSHFFSIASYSIAPLKYGAGIKYKVLESLAVGVPVLGTSVGVEGVENPKVFLAERDEFLEKLILLLKEIK